MAVRGHLFVRPLLDEALWPEDGDHVGVVTSFSGVVLVPLSARNRACCGGIAL